MGKTSLLADYVSASYFFAVLLTALPLITQAARTRDSAIAFFLCRPSRQKRPSFCGVL